MESDNSNSNNHELTKDQKLRTDDIVPIPSNDTLSPTTSQHHDTDLPLLTSIRLYPKIVGYCFALTSAILLWGYDLVIVGTITALPAFQRDFGRPYPHNPSKHFIPAVWLSLWSALGPLGSVIGSIAGGWLQDKIGRRKCLAIGSIISALGVAVVFVSNHGADVESRRSLFLVGKIIQGFAIGIVMVQSQTYCSEIAPTCLRGPALALFPTFTMLGQLAGAIVIYAVSKIESATSYEIAFATQWLFSAAPLVLAFVMPESPAYLVRKRRMDAALKAQEKLLTKQIDAQGVLEKVKMSIEAEEEMAKLVSYWDCFNKANVRRTMIVVYSNLITTLFGLPLLASASYFMQVVGMSARNSLVFLILGIVLGLLSNGVGVWVMSRAGRRPLLTITLSITAVLWTGMGVAGFWSGDVTIWYSAVTMMLVIIVCGVGAWPVSYAVGAETSSLRIRSKTQGVGGLVSHAGSIVCNLVLPYMYNPDAGNLRAKTGLVFGASCLITAVIGWMLVPEMKERSVMEIDRMFELGLPARRFKHWREDEAGVVLEVQQ